MIKNKPVIGILPTYNLSNPENDPYLDQAKFVRMYEQKIYECGGIPIGLLHQNVEDYLDLCDGYLWPGGIKVWSDFFIIIKDAIENKKPLLGICLGFQALGIYFNYLEEHEKNHKLNFDEIKQILIEKEHYLKRLDDDSLHNHIVTKDIETQIKARHSITIKKGTIIQKVMGKDRIDVISLHRFVLPYINPNVTISAYSDDNVIEAIEYTKNDSLILGVQFHPELDNYSNVFQWLIESCYKEKNLLKKIKK